jgi:lipopolysaccharide/colanic/teichoic acid biosynthesis glycosyltransferase
MTTTEAIKHLEDNTARSTPELVLAASPRGAWTRAQRVYVHAGKAVIDRVAAVIVLALTLPLMIAIAIAVRLSLGSGVFFVQERVGRDGRVFKCRKFRTLHHSRRQQQLPFTHPNRRVNHKSPDDPRLTKTGRFLRKWSLDELPQLFNVLAGDMSIVGPRPELPEIVEGYAEPEYHVRHALKPGMTGLWQVSERGDRPMHECVETDLEYVDGVSLLLDLKILALTPVAALGGRTGH